MNNLTTHQLVHTVEKPHKCDKCGKTFAVKNNLTKHRFVHSDKDCQGYRFTKKKNLTQRQCVLAGEELYTCDKCGKALLRRFI